MSERLPVYTQDYINDMFARYLLSIIPDDKIDDDDKKFLETIANDMYIIAGTFYRAIKTRYLMQRKIYIFRRYVK